MPVELVADQILTEEDLFFADNQPPTDLIFDDGAIVL